MEMMKREFSQEQRRRMVESGAAMPDGSYPVANREDLMNAIRSWGRGGARQDVKQHIIRRARALNLESMLPEEWMNAKKVEKMWNGAFVPRSMKP